MRPQEPNNGRQWGPGRTLWCAAVAGALLVGGVSATGAAVDPEFWCQARRAKAAGKYAYCQQKVVMKWWLSGGDNVALNMAAGKCVTKYAATWPTLQAHTSGTGVTCDQARFEDNGDGTVTDNLTGLQWEKKTTEVGSPSDVDNRYTWSTVSDGDDTDADGTAFANIAVLNGVPLAGQADWRLPTRDELLTILEPASPACTSGGPCIDPTFGPSTTGAYWSAGAPFPSTAWLVVFGAGTPDFVPLFLDGKSLDYYVRAVRSGL